MDGSKKSILVNKLLNDELLDYEIYKKLATIEKDKNLKALLGRLTEMEKVHLEIWREFAGAKGTQETAPLIVLLKVYLFVLTRRIIGVAFVTMLLSRNELRALNKYTETVSVGGVSAYERKRLNIIIEDERRNEAYLKDRIRSYKGRLNNIRAIVLGLNDGLVEILAAVAGIAVVASSGLVVVISGIIIGIAGTLSMAGGAYLSSKSHGLLEEVDEPESSSPGSDAIYTGAYYFLGAIVSIIPFALGFSGFLGIILAVILVSLILTTASVIIAVVSGTSIRWRVIEMLAISLGAVVVTVILGTIARNYFGVII